MKSCSMRLYLGNSAGIVSIREGFFCAFAIVYGSTRGVQFLASIQRHRGLAVSHPIIPDELWYGKLACGRK